MAINEKEPVTKEKVQGEMYSQEDPAPIVNYTAGMIIAFVIFLVIALFGISIYFFR